MLWVGHQTGRWGSAARGSFAYDAPGEFVAASYVFFLGCAHFVWVFIVQRTRSTTKTLATASLTLSGLVVAEMFVGSLVFGAVFRTSPPLYKLGSLPVRAIEAMQFPERGWNEYLCKLNAAQLFRQGFFLEPIVATRTARDQWAVLFSIMDGKVGSPNRVVRAFSVRTGGPLQIEALGGCIDAEGVDSAAAFDDGDLVVGCAGYPGWTKHLKPGAPSFVTASPSRTEGYAADPWAEGDLVPILNIAARGPAWARFSERPPGDPGLCVHRVADGGGFEVSGRYAYPPQRIPPELPLLDTVDFRGRYLVAQRSSITVVGPGGPDEEASKTFNDNVRISLLENDVAQVLRVSIGAHDRVYVAGLTSKSSIVLLRLNSEGKRDASFRTLTSASLPFSEAPTGDFVADGSPFKVIKPRRETIRELSNGDIVLFSWNHSLLKLKPTGDVDDEYYRRVTASMSPLGSYRDVFVLGTDFEGNVLAGSSDRRALASMYQKTSGSLIRIRPNGIIAPEDVVIF
jgi:hypothetical protein